MKIFNKKVLLYTLTTLYLTSFSHKSSSSGLVKTIECYRSRPNEMYEEQVISFYEQLGSKCSQKHTFLPATIAFSRRMLKQNENGQYDRSISDSPDFPLYQYIGKLKRNTQGGFEFKTKVLGTSMSISLSDPNSHTTDTSSTASGYYDCQIADFSAICIK